MPTLKCVINACTLMCPQGKNCLINRYYGLEWEESGIQKMESEKSDGSQSLFCKKRKEERKEKINTLIINFHRTENIKCKGPHIYYKYALQTLFG